MYAAQENCPKGSKIEAYAPTRRGRPGFCSGRSAGRDDAWKSGFDIANFDMKYDCPGLLGKNGPPEEAFFQDWSQRLSPAAYALDVGRESPAQLVGYGPTVDAYHMSIRFNGRNSSQWHKVRDRAPSQRRRSAGSNLQYPGTLRSDCTAKVNLNARDPASDGIDFVANKWIWLRRRECERSVPALGRITARSETKVAAWLKPHPRIGRDGSDKIVSHAGVKQGCRRCFLFRRKNWVDIHYERRSP